jgi:hypothetical protein
MHWARLQKITYAHEGPPTTVIRFANLPSLVFPRKNEVIHFEQGNMRKAVVFYLFIFYLSALLLSLSYYFAYNTGLILWKNYYLMLVSTYKRKLVAVKLYVGKSISKLQMDI